MLSKEFLRKGMRVRGITQEDLAKKLGYKGQTGVSNLLNTNKTLTVANLVWVMDELGYDLYAIDRETGVKTKITDKRGKIKPRNTRVEDEALRNVTQNVTQNVTRNVTSVTHVTDEQKMNKNEVVQNTSNEQKSASNEQENSGNEVLKIPEFQYGGGSVTKSNGMRYEK